MANNKNIFASILTTGKNILRTVCGCGRSSVWLDEFLGSGTVDAGTRSVIERQDKLEKQWMTNEPYTCRATTSDLDRFRWVGWSGRHN